MPCIGKQIDSPGPIYNYDPGRGETRHEIFDGTFEACIARAIALRNLRPDLAVTAEPSDGSLWRVTERSADWGESAAAATTVWELLGNEVHKDIYEHPRSLSIDPRVVAQVRGEVAKYDGQGPLPTFAGDPTGNADLLFTLLLKGTNAYLTSQYVLRRTEIVSSKYQVKVAFNQIDSIWSSAQIVTVEAPPAELLFSISNIPIPDSQSGYQWGWLKKSPTVMQASGNRFQITQEWWLEQWSTYLYGIAT